MFGIIDGYLFRRVLSAFISVWILMFTIVVIIDVVNTGLPSLKGVGDVARFFVYYFMFFDKLIGMAIPGFLALAALIALWVIDASHELIALKTMGVSPARIAMSLFAGVVFISLSINVIRELVFPAQVAYMALPRNDYIRHPKELEAQRVLDELGGFYFWGEKINLAEGRVSKPQIIPVGDSSFHENKITANSAEYLKSDGNHPDGWLLDGVSVSESFLVDYSQTVSEGEKSVVQPLFDENGGFKNQIFVSTHIKPVHLAAGDNWFSYGKITELYKASSDPTFDKKTTGLIISVHTRVMRVLTDLIPFFLGIPVYLNRGMGVKCFLKWSCSIVWPALFVGGQFVFWGMGSSLKIPDLAVCGPLLFVPVATVLYCSLLRKEI